jgi:hypothetical protein
MKGIQKVEISNFHPILMQFLENYKFKNNDYHILMTESSWDDSIDGKTYRDSHFSIASDNSETLESSQDKTRSKSDL